jgi:hypothetical protein
MNARGFSLLELLVAAACASLIVGAVCGFARAEGRLLDAEARRLRLREASRRVLSMIVRETRHAGFTPHTGSFDGAADGLTLAERDRIEVRADLHGSSSDDPPDGRLDSDSDERSGFSLNGLRGLVSLENGRQTLPLTIDGLVPAAGLAFRYFDACGDELPSSSTGLAAEARARVTRVYATLTVRDVHGDALTSAASATLRNRNAAICE